MSSSSVARELLSLVTLIQWTGLVNEVWCVAAPSSGFLLQAGEQQNNGKPRHQRDNVQNKPTEHREGLLSSSYRPTYYLPELELKKQQSKTAQLQ